MYRSVRCWSWIYSGSDTCATLRVFSQVFLYTCICIIMWYPALNSIFIYQIYSFLIGFFSLDAVMVQGGIFCNAPNNYLSIIQQYCEGILINSIRTLLIMNSKKIALILQAELGICSLRPNILSTGYQKTTCYYLLLHNK